ncbi:T9SS type A sorting domain-containing protein [Flavobacterium sp.]|uniref:type IX secretion system anionic LPS delivery protein PorZ n=1 Tax=Flavobacterium sp. TaxID=239 RepID=UPI002604514E|nr:T9SS type A sorting domain-containing protein [Flavobacterium sp.]MDD3004382.1 T9SS type A sorting domain-containing protein [Flavobacterium sp.]
MKYFLGILLSLFVATISFGQKNQSWKGYFSYNDIKDISQSSTQFLAASENALFSQNLNTSELKTTNTIDGLSGQTISAIYYSSTYKKTLIGYENGLLIVVNETDGKIKKAVDIINKQLPPNLKKINHFTEYNGIAYLSCDFGIVQFNLSTLLFGDTYFIGYNGDEIRVNQTAIHDGYIYASCTYNGIRKANIESDNLIDFSQWTEINTGNWNGIAQVGNEIVAMNLNGNLHRYNGTNFQPFLQFPQTAVDLRSNENQLAVTFQNKVLFYNSQLAPIFTVNDTQLQQTILPKFTCATVIANKAYIGTQENGVITIPINGTNFSYLLPDGPQRNSAFAINASTENLWVVFGGYPANYNPYEYEFGPLALFGISKLFDKQWLNIPPSEVLGAKALSNIEINPKNINEVYISSFYSGLLKLENDVPTTLYTPTNTAPNGLESIEIANNPNDIRVNNPKFDKAGNLWVTNNLVKKALKTLKTNGQWQSISLETVIPSLNNFNFGSLLIDKNNTKWMASRAGVIAYNENGGAFKVISEGADIGNLPSPDVRTIAIDNRNQLWIGTNKGLRVLSSIDRYNSQGQLTANPIIILEDGVAQELLYQQFITDIVVDGANNKWIGTANSGVFQFSADGKETLQRFTIDNSPLPSNSINDIDINPVTGEVFFATPQGIVVYKGIATDGSDNLKNVTVYPNPVRPGYTGTVKITGLLDNANVKITDISGNLVYETITQGGTIEWDTTAFGKYKVASGVYMIFISAEDGIETAVKKVMIVR